MDKTERDEEMINSLRMINDTLRVSYDELNRLYSEILHEYRDAMNDQFDKRRKILSELHSTQISLAIAKSEQSLE